MKNYKMDYKKALNEILTKVYRNTDDFEMKISKKCYKTIICAFEKQTPKKPDISGESMFLCPNCNHELFSSEEFENNKYCYNCGQKLNWIDSKQTKYCR